MKLKIDRETNRFKIIAENDKEIAELQYIEEIGLVTSRLKYENEIEFTKYEEEL